MKYSSGDIMNYIGKVSAIVVTTNGFVKNNGECVMGRGIAKAIADKYPNIPEKLGTHIKLKGNIVGVIDTIDNTDIISFPVKPIKLINDGTNIVSHAKKKFDIGDTVPGFYAKADLNIITKSSHELNNLIISKDYKHVVAPLFGCGAGELSWKYDVEPIILNEFDNNNSIWFMSFNKEDFIK